MKKRETQNNDAEALCIIRALYVLCTEKKVKQVTAILNDPEIITNFGRATAVCDCLGIQRRGNRDTIVEILGGRN